MLDNVLALDVLAGKSVFSAIFKAAFSVALFPVLPPEFISQPQRGYVTTLYSIAFLYKCMSVSCLVLVT